MHKLTQIKLNLFELAKDLGELMLYANVREINKSETRFCSIELTQDKKKT